MATLDSGLCPEARNILGQYDFVCQPGVTESTSKFDTSFKTFQPLHKVQAKAVPGTKQDGYSEIYRHVACPQTGPLISGYHPSIRTFYDIFKSVVAAYPDREFLGEREYDIKNKKWGARYTYQTYAQVGERAQNLASGMVKVIQNLTGYTPTEKKYIVAVYAPNCSNWIVADMACQLQGLPNVCLYDTLGPETSEYILNYCECPIVISSLANIPAILKLKPKLPNLKAIVCTNLLNDPINYEAPGQSKHEILSAWAHGLDVALYGMDELEAYGKQNPVPDCPPKPNDTYAINFTSGTTGNPKGAIITHQGVIASVAMARTSVDFRGDDVATVFSFLPLAHIYERMAMCATVSLGNKFAFPHGPVTEILDDITVLKPTNCNMVPRVLNRIAAALKDATIEGEGLGGAISRKAYAAKLAHLKKTGSVKHPFWDRIWSNKIRAKLGFQNMKFVNSGSAPLAPATMDFLKCALSMEILQGYGLTESLSGICVAQPGEAESKGCGSISITCEVRLRDVPDLGYSCNDKPSPRGEIMLRGPQIFRGYYKNDEKTLETFDKDGFFHTGDVGMIDSVGRIHIIDRVKNFFKLAQGEYVAAEKIENIYSAKSSLLNQIFVHGDSTETFLIGIISMNPDAFAHFSTHHLGQKFAPTDLAGMSKFLQEKDTKVAVLREINKTLAPGELAGFEKIRNGLLAFEPLTPENDCLTPTLKIKRPSSVKLYRKEIDAMYKEGALDVVPKEAPKHGRAKL